MPRRADSRSLREDHPSISSAEGKERGLEYRRKWYSDRRCVERNMCAHDAQQMIPYAAGKAANGYNSEWRSQKKTRIKDI